MSDIKIICDSLSDITQEYIDRYRIECIPLNVIIDDVEYKDRVSISIEEFYRRIREEKAMPKTSQITYSDFYSVFRRHVDDGKKVIYISAASSATGNMQSAMMARNDIEDGDIRIIDSNTLCFGISILVIRAAELAEAGKSIDEIVDEIEYLKQHTYVSFSCDDLEYLKRGGRISGTKAMLGTVLNIKPICVIKDGIVDNVANARGKKNVVSKIVEIAKENGVCDLSDQIVYIGYTDDLKERAKLEELINREFNPLEIKYFPVGCGIGTHGGPGITGFICFKKYN